nr:hypothetical protein [Sphingomonas sp. CDS-1]
MIDAQDHSLWLIDFRLAKTKFHAEEAIRPKFWLRQLLLAGAWRKYMTKSRFGTFWSAGSC